MHDGFHTWNILGEIRAEGAENDSIFFVRQNPLLEHRWGGIRFQQGSSSNSIIDFCVIDNVYHPTSVPWTYYGGGIYVAGVDITVSNTRISDCHNPNYGGGIYAEYANILVDNCLIVDCSAYSGGSGGGICLRYCNDAVVTNAVVARNSATGT